MTVREVVHGSEDYRCLVDLRRRVLRLPLGLDFSSEELEKESDQRHFGLYEGKELIAVCVVVPKENAWKIRQVAVEPEEQGKGYGGVLMRGLEPFCAEIFLHARDTAVPFYLGLGYEVEGEPFEEVGIPHLAMRKRTGGKNSGTDAGSVSS